MTPVEHDRTAFNPAVWDKIVANSEFAAMPDRFETDEHGQITLSPPPAPSHGSQQSRIAHLLHTLNAEGEVVSECPVSTRKGVKAIDVAWCSAEAWRESEGRSCLLRAPELCVEVVSPSNTAGEIEEKRRLDLEAGAREVSLRGEDGTIGFSGSEGARTGLELFPGFPQVLGSRASIPVGSYSSRCSRVAR